jgi:lipid-A-disaccharide synthase
VRYFFSSGEASGELAAVVLARVIARLDPDARFEGIGASRMRENGFTIWRDHTGWASMGPLAAIPRIPKLLFTMLVTAGHLARSKPDLVVLVDFGAFNLRLAKRLRAIGYKGPMIDVFPPGTWLDREHTARQVAQVAMPLTAFEHQRDFYRSLELPIAYFGHPLASQYAMRAARPAPPSAGGTIAILPGSRGTELRYHVPALLDAYRLLKAKRPDVRARIGAADDRTERQLRDAISRGDLNGIEIVRGTQAAIADADAAWVASGTAVLECALTGVPAVALYIISPALAKHARRVYSGKYITLPNLVSGEEIVPELLQERATPEALAQAMDTVLSNPQQQYERLQQLRSQLGPPDALEQCARFAVDLARSGA